MAEEIEVPSPFGRIRLPRFEYPTLEFPTLDDRRSDALRHALGEDIAELVPVVGDALADIHYAELKQLLTPEELRVFTEENKKFPSVVALAQTFAKVRK